MVKSGTVLYANEAEQSHSKGILDNPYASFASTTFGTMPLERDRSITAVQVGSKNIFIPTNRYPNGEIPKKGDQVEIYGFFKKSICKKGQTYHGLLGSTRTLDGKVIKVETGENFVPEANGSSNGAIAKYHLYTVQTDIGNVLCNGNLRIHNEGESVEVREVLHRWSHSPSYCLKD